MQRLVAVLAAVGLVGNAAAQTCEDKNGDGQFDDPVTDDECGDVVAGYTYNAANAAAGCFGTGGCEIKEDGRECVDADGNAMVDGVGDPLDATACGTQSGHWRPIPSQDFGSCCADLRAGQKVAGEMCQGGGWGSHSSLRCADGLVCGWNDNNQKSECFAVLAAGDTCDQSNDVCGDGLFCESAAGNMCMHAGWLQAGDACTFAGTSSVLDDTTAGSHCAPGFYCTDQDGFAAGTCESEDANWLGHGPGDACRPEDDRCHTPLACATDQYGSPSCQYRPPSSAGGPSGDGPPGCLAACWQTCSIQYAPPLADADCTCLGTCLTDATTADGVHPCNGDTELPEAEANQWIADGCPATGGGGSLPACADGSMANAAACQCGTAECAAGEFCDASQSACSSTAGGGGGSDVHCVGSWSIEPTACTAACETRTYTVTTGASGGGNDCPVADGTTADCQPGEGACTTTTTADTDCVGSWSIEPTACTAACETRTYTVTTNKSGSGSPCEADDGDTTKCLKGQGACDTDPTCNFQQLMAAAKQAVDNDNLGALGNSDVYAACDRVATRMQDTNIVASCNDAGNGR